MGAAQEHQLDAVFLDLCFHIGKVHIILAVFILELIFHNLAAVTLNGVEEMVVDGALNHNAVTGLCHNTDSGRQCGDYAGGLYNPAAVNLPAVTAEEPVFHSGEVAVTCQTVAENSTVHSFIHCFFYAIRYSKIHIRNPHWDHIRGIAALGNGVIFFALGLPAVNGHIKISVEA